MTNCIVSMLMEGNFNVGGYTNGTLTADETASYTLESGAGLIARQSIQELHEIFEVAVIETNEAALASYMEGNHDVMESATYGPVFEASEKSAGKKIVEFLTKLKDRVIAFFQTIGAKLSALIVNYKKFYEKHKDDINKASSREMERIVWDDNKIDGVKDILDKAASRISETAQECINVIKPAVTSKDDEKKVAVEVFDAKCKSIIENAANDIGLKITDGEVNMSTLNAEINEKFREKDKAKLTTDGKYVEKILTKTTEAAKGVQASQKKFNEEYKKAIKTVKDITDNIEKSDKKGYMSYIHKTTSVLSKIQNIYNVYATAGYRAHIGRANEAKSIASRLMSNKGNDK